MRKSFSSPQRSPEHDIESDRCCRENQSRFFFSSELLLFMEDDLHACFFSSLWHQSHRHGCSGWRAQDLHRRWGGVWRCHRLSPHGLPQDSLSVSCSLCRSWGVCSSISFPKTSLTASFAFQYVSGGLGSFDYYCCCYCSLVV